MGFSNGMTNQQISESVDSTSNNINESGVYFGEITLAEYSKSPAGAGFVKISIKTDEGKDLQYVDFCVQKRDGSDSFGMAFYHAMCNFTNTQPSEPVQSRKDPKIWGFPALYEKKIGIGVQVEFKEEFNDKGYQKSDKKLVSVFDYKTKKSAREIAMGLPAVKWQEPIEDKGTKLGKRSAQTSDDFYGPANYNQPQLPTDDLELPF